MHSWGFALREGVFTETKEGKMKHKREKIKKKTSRLLGGIKIRTAIRIRDVEIWGYLQPTGSEWKI